MPLQDDYKNYLRSEKRSSEHTIKAYVTDVDQFFDYAELGWDAVAEVNTAVIRGWLSSLMDEGVSARSVNRKIAALNTFFHYLMRKGIVTVNPTRKITKPKINKSLPKFVDEDKFIDYLNENVCEDNYESVRDATILELFYATGMRVAELVNLTHADIDFDRQQIKVLGKRNKERLIPMTFAIEEKLKYYLEKKKLYMVRPENNFLFLTAKGTKVYPKLVYLTVKRQMTQAGFSGKRSPHVLRHSFATHMLNHGAELNGVKEMLGHANLAATQIYTHNTFEKLKKTYKKAHPRA